MFSTCYCSNAKIKVCPPVRCELWCCTEQLDFCFVWPLFQLQTCPIVFALKRLSYLHRAKNWEMFWQLLRHNPEKHCKMANRKCVSTSYDAPTWQKWLLNVDLRRDGIAWTRWEVRRVRQWLRRKVLLRCGNVPMNWKRRVHFFVFIISREKQSRFPDWNATMPNGKMKISPFFCFVVPDRTYDLLCRRRRVLGKRWDTKYPLDTVPTAPKMLGAAPPANTSSFWEKRNFRHDLHA